MNSVRGEKERRHYFRGGRAPKVVTLSPTINGQHGEFTNNVF
jgi:hypothetical protein